jgi:hypothetical protein
MPKKRSQRRSKRSYKKSSRRKSPKKSSRKSKSRSPILKNEGKYHTFLAVYSNKPYLYSNVKIVNNGLEKGKNSWSLSGEIRAKNKKDLKDYLESIGDLQGYTIYA